MELLARRLFDADHEDFRASVRRFLAAEVGPRLEEWRAGAGVPPELYARLGAEGFLGTAVPEEHGGGGVVDPRFVAVLVEELAAAGSGALAWVAAQHAGVVLPAMLGLPANDVRDAWLAGMATGELLAVAAPAAGTVARAVPAAGAAGVFLVLVGDDLRLLDAAAVSIEPVSLLAGTEVGAADLAIPAGVGVAIPSGAAPVLRDLDLWAGVVAAAAARAALQLTIAYVGERKVFGRPIAEFENTRFRLAELGAELASAQLLVDEALLARCEDRLTPAAAAAARLVAGQVHDRVVDQGMQLHGGYGYMREYPISHAFADARLLRTVAAIASEPRRLLAEAIGI